MKYQYASALLWFAACSSGATSTGISELTCPPGSTLTYANFGEAAIEEHCMSCHVRESPQLGSHSHVKLQAGRILDEAVYTDAMPQDAEMSLDERRMLGEWLACGAP